MDPIVAGVILITVATVLYALWHDYRDKREREQMYERARLEAFQKAHGCDCGPVARDLHQHARACPFYEPSETDLAYARAVREVEDGWTPNGWTPNGWTRNAARAAQPEKESEG